MHLDLSDLGSVRKFALDFKQKYNRLDILINNAAVMAIKSREMTKDGLEMQMATNHFGHFLLTNLLLEMIKSSKPSRIINIAALAHKWVEIDLNDINSLEKYSGHLTYAKTKLANILFTRELAKRLKGTDVKAVCLHPGVIRTDLARHVVKRVLFKATLMIFYPFYWFFMKNVEQGAQTTLFCALEDLEKMENGGYYSDCRIAETSQEAMNDQKMKKLWDISLKMVNL